VALKVDDLDAIVADLEAKGVRAYRLPHVPGAGRQAFVSDPSGNQIELNQPD
jgi:catechol 2,3-dioxygenase-like lactoylglutathione lyase family enzyme